MPFPFAVASLVGIHPHNTFHICACFRFCFDVKLSVDTSVRMGASCCTVNHTYKSGRNHSAIHIEIMCGHAETFYPVLSLTDGFSVPYTQHKDIRVLSSKMALKN